MPSAGDDPMSDPTLEAENARLRARVQALEDVMAESSPGRRIRELEAELQTAEQARDERNRQLAETDAGMKAAWAQLTSVVAGRDDLLAARDRLVAQMRVYGDSPHLPRGQVAEWDEALASLGSPAPTCVWRREDEDADSYPTAPGKLWEFTV